MYQVTQHLTYLVIGSERGCVCAMFVSFRIDRLIELLREIDSCFYDVYCYAKEHEMYVTREHTETTAIKNKYEESHLKIRRMITELNSITSKDTVEHEQSMRNS